MDFIRRYFLILLPIAFLALLFLLLSLLSSLFRNNKRTLRWKIKVGALMVSLMGISVHGAWSSCYEVAEPEFSIRIDSERSDILELNRNAVIEVNAFVSYGEGQEFTYVIMEEDDTFVHMGRVLPVDGKHDSWEEQMVIPIDTAKLSDGKMYLLCIYWGNYSDPSELNSFDQVAEYPLVVHEE